MERFRWWTEVLRRGPRLLVRVAVAVALVVTVLLVLTGRRRPPAPDGGAPARPPAPATARPSPPPSPSPHAGGAPAEPVRRSASVTLSFDAPAAPAPTPGEAAATAPAPAPAPSATPEPAVARCVTFRWSASPSPVRLGDVLVSIEATNTCRRTFAPLDVWFQISAYHEGGLVTTLPAHPFDPLYGGGTVEVLAAVPGSLDWYDRIEVRLTTTPAP